MATETYTAKNIQVLEGLEPVRKRPGMYIGGVSSAGLHHLVWEILDNSIDEAMNGHAKDITVTLHKDGSSITVVDDGRGIPIDKHPKHKKTALEIIFSTLHAGDLYSLRLDGQAALLPDPASRSQPSGPHGPSRIVDPARFAWSDSAFRGTRERGQVLYEMHIGTFTKEGTYRAAAEHLPHLVETGITTLEVMPLADFPGDFGWGYDGVGLWAPTRLYGEPDDLRRFIDRAHQLGLAVILDVVYNHLGPDGAYLKSFSSSYFTDRYSNEWGEAINFDGEESAAVREFFVENARYWLLEYHFDGLRLDATQALFDSSERHVIADIASAVQSAAQGTIGTEATPASCASPGAAWRAGPRGPSGVTTTWPPPRSAAASPRSAAAPPR